MKRAYPLKDIYSFAMSRPTWGMRVSYLIKGFLLLPWLSKNLSVQANQDQAIAASSEVGDDIYPLF